MINQGGWWIIIGQSQIYKKMEEPDTNTLDKRRRMKVEVVEEIGFFPKFGNAPREPV